MRSQQYDYKINLLLGNLNIRISLLSTADPESVLKATHGALGHLQQQIAKGN